MRVQTPGCRRCANYGKFKAIITNTGPMPTGIPLKDLKTLIGGIFSGGIQRLDSTLDADTPQKCTEG